MSESKAKTRAAPEGTVVVMTVLVETVKVVIMVTSHRVSVYVFLLLSVCVSGCVRILCGNVSKPPAGCSVVPVV